MIARIRHWFLDLSVGTQLRLLPAVLTVGLVTMTLFTAWHLGSLPGLAAASLAAADRAMLSQRYVRELLLAVEGEPVDHRQTRAQIVAGLDVGLNGGQLTVPSGERIAVEASEDPIFRGQLEAQLGIVDRMCALATEIGRTGAPTRAQRQELLALGEGLAALSQTTNRLVAAQEHAHLRQVRIVSVIASAALLALFLWLCRAIDRAITAPLHRVVCALSALARGDLTARVPVESRNELGRLSHALNRTATRLGATARAIHDSAQALGTVSGGADARAEALARDARSVAEEAASVRGASEAITRSVQGLEVFTEDMSGTLFAVADSAGEAGRVARRGVQLVSHTYDAMRRLKASSVEIAKVVETITSITEQTHLLALNASIEASRAGEAGRSFAVVAENVKELARDTATSTEGIQAQVEAITREAQATYLAICEITGVIGQIHALQHVIAEAVSAHSRVAGQVGAHLAQASDSNAVIVSGLSRFIETADRTAATADTARGAARDLSALAGALHKSASVLRP